MKTPHGIFVTGTDTEVGKTYVSCALLKMLNRQGISTIAMKPVASGAEKQNGKYVNDDALCLHTAASMNAPYDLLNPYVFPDPIAPHIAAAKENIEIDFQQIKKSFQTLSELADFILVEGVGGWLVPLNHKQTVADLALMLNLPVVMVVGMRLGCINHALLTANAIQQSGACLQGWIANKLEGDYPCVGENIEAIAQRLDVPLLATLDYQLNADRAELVCELVI